MLVLAVFAVDNQMLQQAHADAGHDKMEPDHNKMGSGKDSEDSGPEFIRTRTPAGHDAVIGTKNPLEELKYETVDMKEGPVKVFQLTVRDVGFEIFPDKSLVGWGFNGQVPGPTIRVIQGDRIRIIFKNETDEGDHTLHVHGQSKPMAMDGVPFLGQKPKKKELAYDREYIMILDEWPTAHVHVHQDPEPTEGHDEHGVMTLHDESTPMHEDKDKKDQKKRDWYPETYEPRQEVYDGFTINGRSFPFTEPVMVKKGEKVRIRFINVGYQQHFMHTHSHRFTVVARDGSYVNEPQEVDTIGIGPGQRLDVIFEADNPGTWPFHCHRLNHVTNENTYPGGMLTFIHYEE